MLACALGAILPFTVCSSASGNGPVAVCSNYRLTRLGIKAMAATIYSEFETHVVDDSGMEQIDGILAGPVGDKLLLKFRYVGRDVFSKEA